ncbi:MAG: glycerate kinase [Negativicutes bacterium]|jgi:glycerate kinase
MKIVIAADSYKGTLSSPQVADIIERGLATSLPQAEYLKIPVADGGEGTVDAVVTATCGSYISVEVTGPLGNVVNASYGVTGDGTTAVIEMAAASGLPLVPSERLDALGATTFGTGQLIRDALKRGLRKIIIGLGGSATTDGGVGMAQALGVKFLKANGCELGYGGGELLELKAIDCSQIDSRLREASILVACDVDILLYGDYGAARNYARQKGATDEMINILDAGLENYANVALAATGIDAMAVPGCGAAGGTAAALLYFFGASLVPGAELVLGTIEFEKKIVGADLVITGEGRTDFQTLQGKAPAVVAQIANRHSIPAVCISGALDDSAEELLDNGTFAAMFSTVVKPCAVADCLKNAEANLFRTAKNIGALLSVKNLTVRQE